MLMWSSFVVKAQDMSSINYFYNLGYHNPAYVDDYKGKADFNSISLYNNLPTSVTAMGLYGQINTTKGLGGSVQINSSVVGKSNIYSRYQFSFNYTTNINLRHSFTFGLGFKIHTNTFDESDLLVDVDLSDFRYSYGNGQGGSVGYQLPFGVSFVDSKVKVGAYFNKGIFIENAYGVYSDLFLFRSQVNSYDLKDYLGISFYKDFFNSKVAVNNSVEIDNYKIDLFYSYDLGSNLRRYQSVGIGLFYNWRVFDINYQIAINNNTLGFSHQIGLQCYLD